MVIFMKTYVFYVRNKDIKVINKNELTKSEKDKLKKSGFKKYYLEIDANDKNDAIERLNERTNENLDALISFSGSYVFSTIFIVISLFLGLAYYYL